MGILSGGAKVEISPTWSTHGQEKAEKAVGRHRSSSVTSIEDSIPQKGKGKKLPGKSLFSRKASHPAKATEKRAVKEFVAALDDVKKAANSKKATSASVLKVVAKHANNPRELEDLLANLPKKAAGRDTVQQAFKELGTEMLVLDARHHAHKTFKGASSHGTGFRGKLDANMADLRTKLDGLKTSSFPDSIKKQLEPHPALARCLVEEMPGPKNNSVHSALNGVIKSQTLLACQCFEEARQLNKDLGKLLQMTDLPPETRGKAEKTLEEVREMLHDIRPELKSLEKSHFMQKGLTFLSHEYAQSIANRSETAPVRRGSISQKEVTARRQSLESVQQEAPAKTNKGKRSSPRRAAPAPPFQAILGGLKKDKPELKPEIEQLESYLNQLKGMNYSTDLLNYLGSQFSSHSDEGWSYTEYTTLCQHAAQAVFEKASLTPVQALEVGYAKMGV